MNGIFDSLARIFQFRFNDRVSAANILSEALKDTIKKEEQSSLLILGIPRGGIVTADIIAKKLSAPLDIIIPRKLTDPDNKEHAIGAIMEDGTTYLDQELIKFLSISQDYLAKEKAYQIGEIRRRNLLYRKSAQGYNFEGKTVVLVDDGAATGATVIVAARWIRKQPNKPKRLIIALPVTSKETAMLLQKECDTLEIVMKPSSGFRAVAQYYKDFNQISDDEVKQIIQKRNIR
jgi:putative phosphoribosyl transferase